MTLKIKSKINTAQPEFIEPTKTMPEQMYALKKDTDELTRCIKSLYAKNKAFRRELDSVKSELEEMRKVMIRFMGTTVSPSDTETKPQPSTTTAENNAQQPTTAREPFVSCITVSRIISTELKVKVSVQEVARFYRAKKILCNHSNHIIATEYGVQKGYVQSIPTTKRCAYTITPKGVQLALKYFREVAL